MLPLSVIDDNIDLLNSGAAILDNISDEQYNHIVTPCFSVSAGKHYRHILDHYFCFFAGLTSGKVDYDARKRETDIETDRTHAARGITQVAAQLKQLRLTTKNRQSDQSTESLEVRIATSTHGKPKPVSSSLHRELIFLHGHTTHHYAIIAAILKLQDCNIDYVFGIAPSTLVFEEQSAKCAP